MTGKNGKKPGLALSEQTDGELQFRLNLVRAALKLLRTDEDMRSDPRQPSAIEKYKGQRDRIQAEMRKRGLIEKQTKIGLKAAKLSAKVNK